MYSINTFPNKVYAKLSGIKVFLLVSRKMEPPQTVDNPLAPLLVASQNVSAGKASLPGFFFFCADGWLTVPALANGIQELFCRGYSSCFILLFYLGVTSKCFCLICIREKTDSLLESVQCNTFLLAWSRSRLKQKRVAYHTTHVNVNLDLFSPSVGEEHGCIQNASRNSAGAAALRHKIEAIRCFLQVLWSCSVWIASSHTSRMLLVLPWEKEVGAGSQPATWQQQGSHAPCTWEWRVSAHSQILNTKCKRLKWPA